MKKIGKTKYSRIVASSQKWEGVFDLSIKGVKVVDPRTGKKVDSGNPALTFYDLIHRVPHPALHSLLPEFIDEIKFWADRFDDAGWVMNGILEKKKVMGPKKKLRLPFTTKTEARKIAKKYMVRK